MPFYQKKYFKQEKPGPVPKKKQKNILIVVLW